MHTLINSSSYPRSLQPSTRDAVSQVPANPEPPAGLLPLWAVPAESRGLNETKLAVGNFMQGSRERMLHLRSDVAEEICGMCLILAPTSVPEGQSLRSDLLGLNV